MATEVRWVYLYPSDKTYSATFEAAFLQAAINTQKWYLRNSGIYATFAFHNPIIEVYQTSHVASFYETSASYTRTRTDGFALTGGSTSEYQTKKYIFFITDTNPTNTSMGALNNVACMNDSAAKVIAGEKAILGAFGHELGHTFNFWSHGSGHPPSTSYEYQGTIMGTGYTTFPYTTLPEIDRTDIATNGAIVTPFFTTQTIPDGYPLLLQKSRDVTDLSTYTFTSQSFGAANATRSIVVSILARDSGVTVPAISSITIGGVAATLLVQNINSLTNTSLAAIAVAAVPTGTSGTVVVNFNTTMDSCDIGVYRITGVLNYTPYDTVTSTSSNPSGSIDIPDNGVVIGAAITERFNYIISTTGLDLDFVFASSSTDVAPEVRTLGGMSKTFSSPQTNYAVGVDFPGSPLETSAVWVVLETTISASVSPSASVSWSKSPSASVSLSQSPSASRSLSRSPSASVSPSASISRSPSLSGSPSVSSSASISPSASISLSASPSASVSPSVSRSLSSSISPSASVSLSPSLSGSLSVSPSASVSPSGSVSLSRSPSASVSPSASGSLSISPSASVSLSQSPSESHSPSASVSLSKSPSASISLSQSPSASISRSSSASPSLSLSNSLSVSPSASRSVSVSPSPSSTPPRQYPRLRYWKQYLKRF